MSRIAMLGVLVMAMGLYAEAAKADAKGDVQNAAKKLGEAASYSWTSTPSMGGGGGGARFQPGPTNGKTEKDGYTLLTMTMGENSTEAALKGGKIAVKMQDGWKSSEELAAAGGGAGGGQPGGQQGGRRGRDPSRRLRNFKAPAAEAADLVEKVKDLKEEGGACSGEMTEEGAKSLLSFGRGGGGAGGGQGPEISGAKGTVKFWLKDGVLAKYEYNVQGKVKFGDREVDMNRTTVVEIKDVGSTKVEVPEDAKKKLG